MDVLKINTELLKGIHLGSLRVLMDGDFRWVATRKGHWVIRLHKDHLYLADRLFTGFNKDSLFVNMNDHETAEKTNDLYKIGKSTYMRLKGQHQEAWVDVSYIKLFDKEAQFKVLNHTAPLAAYERGDLVGLIMPLKRT